MSLSERIRPGIEAAPWVVIEVGRLEAANAALLAKLEAAEAAATLLKVLAAECLMRRDAESKALASWQIAKDNYTDGAEREYRAWERAAIEATKADRALREVIGVMK